MEAVLLYQCKGSEFQKLRQIFMMLRVRMIPVEPEQYGLSLEQVLQGDRTHAPVEENLEEPMLVFCGIGDQKLDQILMTIRRAKLPPIGLKAMLTPHNVQWTSQQLWTELRQERERMKNG